MNHNEKGASGTGNYAPVNGLGTYYEVHGEPMILLHGGIGAIEMFGEVLPLLARSFEAMADGVAALIEHLGAEEADAMGHSPGGERDAGWDGSGMPELGLAILPDTTRYEIFRSPELASTVGPFLDARVEAAG